MTKPVSIPKVRKHWTMRDGTKMPIYKMSNQHLANTIKMLQRGAAKHREPMLRSMYSLSDLIRGEMASLDLDNAIDILENDVDGESLLPSIYDDLLRDAERRGLTID